MFFFSGEEALPWTRCLLIFFDFCRRGFTSLAEAAEDALAALAACRAPAQSSAPQLQIARGGIQHLPDFEGWRDTMTHVHSSLSASSSVVQVTAVSPDNQRTVDALDDLLSLFVLEPLHIASVSQGCCDTSVFNMC